MKSEPPTGDELTRLLVTMKRNVLEQVAHEPAAEKRPGSTSGIVALGVGVTLLLGLGAGAAFALGILPPATEPSTSATAPPAPGPTASSEPAASPQPAPPAPPREHEDISEQPESRYGIDCGTLVDESLISDLFTVALEPRDPIATAASMDIGIPKITSVLSVGGTACEWSSGVETPGLYNPATDYASLTVSVLPRATAGWSERARAHGMPAETNRCDDGACWASAEVGDAWVSVMADGGGTYASNGTGWQPLLDAVIERVRAAGPAAPARFAEQTTHGGPQQCETIIPLADVHSITSAPEVQARRMGGGGWSEWAEASLYAGEIGCWWGIEDWSVAGVSWIHGGRWAYERMLLAGTSAPVEPAWLESGDDAVIRCHEESGRCAVDLAIGPDWFNVSGGDRETAIALAEAMLRHSPK